MPARILLVEDNAGDAQLMRIAFAEAAPEARLSVVTDGETALRTLLEATTRPTWCCSTSTCRGCPATRS